MGILRDGPWFKDEAGRTLFLRGVNIGGSSKVPFAPDGATHIRQDFFNHQDVSFVGRPFPLEQADEHFHRLKTWGFNLLRVLVTWEAVEHAGPGQYDSDYLEFLRAVMEEAAKYEINVLIDPHQDVWSRFSGGDGAPGWTFEAIGLDITRFDQTGAAITHQVTGDPFPRMIWPTNSGKLAAATMFTLFFGGNDFAPDTKIDGEPAQEFLQRHYIESMVEVAKVLNGMKNVIGFDTMNEPLMGYIGREDLTEPFGLLRLGVCPSPFQSMLLGYGFTQSVGDWKLDLRGNRIVRQVELNTEGVTCWLPGFDCVWKQNGVWELDEQGKPYLVCPDHFSQVGGKPVRFSPDYYNPFANRFASAIRQVLPDVLIFLESTPRQGKLHWSADDADRVVHAPHWYDGFVLFMKDYHSFIAFDEQRGSMVLGKQRIRRNFAEQLSQVKQQGVFETGPVPTLIGEFGIAFDLKKCRAYQSGNFSAQIGAMDRSFRAIEDNLLSCALWNYTADNDNQHGDQWNGEDLSIFSRDQQVDLRNIYSGGRALEAVIRPYPLAVAGEPRHLSFDLKLKRFSFSFRHDPAVREPTELFVPWFQYPSGFQVELSDGSYTYTRESQVLHYFHTSDMPEHTIVLRP